MTDETLGASAAACALEPLTGADCDLCDFPCMLLDVARFRDSDMVAHETPEVCFAAMLLAAASWHQVPAASIPDDDNWIAKAANYRIRGKTDRRWHSIRAGVLREWKKCGDGRLYHPGVAQKARDAFRSKLEQRWRSECARIAKLNARAEEEGAAQVQRMDFNEWLAAGAPFGSEGDLMLRREHAARSAQERQGQEVLQEVQQDAPSGAHGLQQEIPQGFLLQAVSDGCPADMASKGERSIRRREREVEGRVEVEGEERVEGEENFVFEEQKNVCVKKGVCVEKGVQGEKPPAPKSPPPPEASAAPSAAPSSPQPASPPAARPSGLPPPHRADEFLGEGNFLQPQSAPGGEGPRYALQKPEKPEKPEKPQKPQKPAKTASAVEKPDCVDAQVWNDFLAIRKAHKAPLTPTAFKGIESEAARAGIDVQQALQTCCEAGWRGFKADWYANRNGGAGGAFAQKLAGQGLFTPVHRMREMTAAEKREAQADEAERNFLASLGVTREQDDSVIDVQATELDLCAQQQKTRAMQLGLGS